MFLQTEKCLGIVLVIMFSNAITNGKLLPTPSLTLKETHLVRCLTHISHRHFAPGRSVVISSPATYRDIQQELIAEIHGTSIWPVVVAVDGNISIPEKTNFIDRDGSYIILIPDGNIINFMTEINGLAEESFGYTKLWNSEARFVVAGANKFSVSQQIDIFDHFSKFRIYNCIVVSLDRDEIHKLYKRPIRVNDVDIGITLVVYTWFPYQSSDRCTEVNDITLLDSWVISAQGYLTKNTDLFPRKISNSLNGCPMKAVVRDSGSHYTTNYDNVTNSNGRVATEVDGLELELLMMILEQLNMTFVHVPTPEDFIIGSDLTNNLIKGLMAKDVFIALGLLAEHNLVDTFLESSNSYYTLTSHWYLPCFYKFHRRTSLFRIMSLELWIVLIISIVIAAVSITLVARYSCTPEWQGYKTM